ncbi:MAG: hypothetical protein J7539_10465 [Niabella sp.]|nr:hypothetical protein [Niabella sp.]
MKALYISSLLITKLFGTFCFSWGQAGYNRAKLDEYYQNQDYEQALAYLQSIVPADTNEYLFDLGYVTYMNGHAKEARAIFTTLYHKDSSSCAPQIYLALLFEQNRIYDSALFYYQNLTRLLPKNYKYWQAGARQWARLNYTDSAVAYAQKSYQLNPASGSVVYDLATYLKIQKRKAEAEQLVDVFLKQDTTYDPVIGQKVAFCFTAKRYPEAIRWGKLYQRREADFPTPYVNLLYSYLNVNDPDGAISLYKWMELKNMIAESIAYGAALAYAAKKNYKTSDSLLSVCLKLNIQEPAVTYLRAKGANATSMKNYKQAATYYDTAYYMFHDPVDLYLAGNIFDKYLRDTAKATIYYRKFQFACTTPKSPDEVSISQYIKEFLSTRKR